MAKFIARHVANIQRTFAGMAPTGLSTRARYYRALRWMLHYLRSVQMGWGSLATFCKLSLSRFSVADRLIVPDLTAVVELCDAPEIPNVMIYTILSAKFAQQRYTGITIGNLNSMLKVAPMGSQYTSPVQRLVIVLEIFDRAAFVLAERAGKGLQDFLYLAFDDQESIVQRFLSGSVSALYRRSERKLHGFIIEPNKGADEAPQIINHMLAYLDVIHREREEYDILRGPSLRLVYVQLLSSWYFCRRAAVRGSDWTRLPSATPSTTSITPTMPAITFTRLTTNHSSAVTSRPPDTDGQEH